MNMDNLENKYHTSDFNLAATLTLFIPLAGLSEPDSNGRRSFYFNDVKKAEEIKEKYFLQELRVDPMLLCQKIKALKSRLYDNS